MQPTKIDWCDRVWNPTTGCSKDCAYCYARKMAHRFKRSFAPTCHPERLDQPSRLRKPARIFVDSAGDLFDPAIPDEFIWQVFRTMTYGNRRHTYHILTKRPQRMCQWFVSHQEQFWHYHAPDESPRPYVSAPWPDPCIWLGVTVEDQFAADERIPLLLQTPAALRFLSVEPMTGPVWIHDPIDWVIIGAMTGPNAVPCDPAWVAALIHQCRIAGVPVFVKGVLHQQFPIQEYPHV